MTGTLAPAAFESLSERLAEYRNCRDRTLARAARPGRDAGPSRDPPRRPRRAAARPDGEVSASVLTDFPERFAPGEVFLWRRGGEERSLTLSAVRPHGKRLLLALRGRRQRGGGARASPAATSASAAGKAFPAPEGFFYEHEILGWTCEDARGRWLGVAAGLEATPAGPLLSVETRPGKVALVPFVDGIVVEVDRPEAPDRARPARRPDGARRELTRNRRMSKPRPPSAGTSTFNRVRHIAAFAPAMQIEILTIFPGYFASPLRESLLGKAIAGGLRGGAAPPTCGPSPWTVTARSTTSPTAGGREWS